MHRAPLGAPRRVRMEAWRCGVSPSRGRGLSKNNLIAGGLLMEAIAPSSSESGDAPAERSEAPSGRGEAGLGRTHAASAACVRTSPHPAIRLLLTRWRQERTQIRNGLPTGRRQPRCFPSPGLLPDSGSAVGRLKNICCRMSAVAEAGVTRGRTLEHQVRDERVALFEIRNTRPLEWLARLE